MKNSINTVLFVKIIFRGIAAAAIIIGLFFSFLIAELEDAPGFVLIGTAVVLAGASIVYGIGEIIIHLKKNNELLSNINEKLKRDGHI